MATTHTGTADGSIHHLNHSWGDETPVADRIVAAVAEYENEPEDQLPAVERSIDPHALERLFASSDGNLPRAGCVTFSYYGYTVVVQSTGKVLLRQN